MPPGGLAREQTRRVIQCPPSGETRFLTAVGSRYIRALNAWNSGVPPEADRLLAAVAGKPGVQVGAIRSNLGGVQDLRLDALPIENRLEKPGAEDLVAGRVGGVDSQIIGEDALRFAGECVPVESRRLRPESRSSEKADNEADYNCDTIHGVATRVSVGVHGSDRSERGNNFILAALISLK